jgi:phosphatidylglycerophosphate synthase
LAIAGFLYQFASMFDGVDGEMARVNLSESEKGAWIDSSIDYFTHAICLGGLIIGWLRSDVSLMELYALAAIAAGLLLVNTGVARLVKQYGPEGEAMLLTHFSIWVNKAAGRPDCPITLRMANALFPIVRRDMVAMLLMLATFTGYRETLGLLVAFGLGIGAYALIFHRRRIIAESDRGSVAAGTALAAAKVGGSS